MFVYFCFRAILCNLYFFFFSSRRRHTRLQGDWSSDVCSSDLLVCCCRWRLGLRAMRSVLVACNFSRRVTRKRLVMFCQPAFTRGRKPGCIVFATRIFSLGDCLRSRSMRKIFLHTQWILPKNCHASLPCWIATIARPE